MNLSPITVSRPSGFPAGSRMFARAAGTGFDARAAGAVSEIELYDEIGAFGISASAFREKLKAAPGDVVLRINSPGGDVFDGIAMFNDLVAHDGQVRVEIAGVAASAASIVAMAGDQIAIAENAFLMIHNAWGLLMGNRHDAREFANVLERIDGAMARTYAGRSGQGAPKMAALMDAESWLTGDDAKALGLVSEVTPSTRPRARFDLSAFANTPAALAWSGEAGQIESPHDLESILRRGGLSRAAARKVTAGGWSALAGPDDTDAILTLAARVKAAAETIGATT